VLELLTALWNGWVSPGVITFWMRPTKRSLHVPLNTLPTWTEADAQELFNMVIAEDAYFGLGARMDGLRPHEVGGKNAIIAMPAFALDIDFQNDIAHSAHALPRDLHDAERILQGAPAPSAIVDTGNGIHAYWFFQEPAITATRKERRELGQSYCSFQKPFLQRAQTAGWHMDSTATINRVWRVPGTVNQKTRRPVRLLHLAQTRYSVSSLVCGTRVAELAKVKLELERLPKTATFYNEVQAMLRGESFAERGRRDEVLQGVCSTIAWMPSARERLPADLAELLRPTLKLWASETDARRSLSAEMDKAIDKISRSQLNWREKQAAAAPQINRLAEALRVKAGSKTSADFVTHHAIIQYKNCFFVYDFTRQRYSPMKVAPELVGTCRIAWKDAPECFSLMTHGAKIRAKTVPELLEDYSTVCDEVVGLLNLQESYYDQEQRIFYEAIARRRVQQSQYDREIAEWLALLGGEQADILRQWIAAVPLLDRQNSALYLQGVTGIGKGVLANGLARLWHLGPPTSFEVLLSGFNGSIGQCPFIWIDEGIASARPERIANEVRSLITGTMFSLNTKFLPLRSVVGSARLFIAANNGDALQIGSSSLSLADLEAVVGRFVHIVGNPESVPYLAARTSSVRSWIDDDRLAKHALWLSENETFPTEGRFLVQGTQTRLHEMWTLGGESNSAIYEWVARFATEPDRILKTYQFKRQTPQALIGDGQILIAVQAIRDFWRDIMTDDAEKCPTAQRIGRALRQIGKPCRYRGTRYYAILVDLLGRWVDEFQVGNLDRIQCNMQRSLNDIME
jgi:hypothetical protein